LAGAALMICHTLCGAAATLISKVGPLPAAVSTGQT